MNVYRVIKDGVTHWVTGQTFDEASKTVGCSKVIGGNCTFKQYLTPEGTTAEAYRTQLSGGTAATPTPTPTPTPTTQPTDATTGMGGPLWQFTTKPATKATQPSIPAIPSPTPTSTTYTEEQQLDYQDYLNFLKTPRGSFFTVPKDIADYLANEAKWMNLLTEQEREFATYKKYASKYGTPDDWYALTINDFYTNYTQAQKQLSTWQREAGVAEEEIAEREATAAAREEYALPPEEVARRREEAYGESRYAAEERYREQPMYGETFAGWIQGQSETSQALQAYIKSEYPSLQAEYKAGVGALTGFPTREEARTEAGRRESGWQAWLGERLPETTQEYYMQRPYARGERYRDYSPSLRTVNW